MTSSYKNNLRDGAIWPNLALELTENCPIKVVLAFLEVLRHEMEEGKG